jgi:Rrf2 family protein
MKISSRGLYALKALTHLAEAYESGLVKIHTVAEEEEIPEKFLEGILVTLKNARIVASQRGREGGYRLAQPAGEISLAQVMRVEQGFLADVRGERPEDLDYPGSAESLKTVWVAARAAYRRVLEEVTLADLIAGKLPQHVLDLVAVEDAWRSGGVPTH